VDDTATIAAGNYSSFNEFMASVGNERIYVSEKKNIQQTSFFIEIHESRVGAMTFCTVFAFI
jgi:hypothetical protein